MAQIQSLSAGEEENHHQTSLPLSLDTTTTTRQQQTFDNNKHKRQRIMMPHANSSSEESSSTTSTTSIIMTDKMRLTEVLNNYENYNATFDSTTEKLVKLVFRGHDGMTEIPEAIGQDFLCLKHLELQHCHQISSLPTSVGQNYTQLQVLRIYQCSRMTSIFPSQDDNHDDVNNSNNINLIGLQRLTIESCPRLTHLPTMEGFPHLEELHIADCPEITSLPHSIGVLKNLKHLHLKDFRRLTTLPASLCHLESLQTLQLDEFFALTELPDQLGNLKQLQQLILWCCYDLTSIPESIGRLDKLEYLEIWHHDFEHALTSLPASIGHLPNLEKLILRFPTVLTFLNSIHRMDSLQYFHLMDCGIEEQDLERIWQVLWDKFPSLTTVKLPLCSIDSLQTLTEQSTHLKSIRVESSVWRDVSKAEIVASGMLQRIMGQNLDLYEIESLVDGKLPPAVAHLRDINRFGRLLLDQKVPLPQISVWPTMLAKAHNANVLYHLLRYNPSIAMMYNDSTFPAGAEGEKKSFK